MEVLIAHQVKEVGQVNWDQFSGDEPFASYRWYQYGEAVLSNDTPLYIIASHKGEPVARATFWLTRDEPLPLPGNAARMLLGAAFRRWPLLMCRTPMASHSGLVLPSDNVLREKAINAITNAAKEYSQRQGVSFIIYDYLETSELKVDDFSEFEMPDAGTELRISWTSFDEYLQQLGKSARKDYNRHHNRAQDLGVEIKTGGEAPDLDTVLTLVQNVERNHNTPPNARTRRALDHLDIVDATWITARVAGSLVGCGVLLGEGKTRALAFLGLDYRVQYVYFQLMYAAIRCAIELGISVLWGGTGAYEFKERLGFQPISNNQIVFSANNRLVGRAVRHLVAS
jgi:predicted N-acyltransferase